MTNQADHQWVGAVNLIVDDEGKILLMKRSQSSKAHAGKWGLVGGFIDPNETGEEGAKREAKEEIGVDIDVQKFIGRFYNTPHPTKGIIIALPFYSKIIAGTPYCAQPEECSGVKWFIPEEIRQMELAYDHKQILTDEGLI